MRKSLYTAGLVKRFGAGGVVDQVDVALVTGDGFVYHADADNSYQDSPQTTPVASDGDPIASLDDLTSNNNDALTGVASFRPSWIDPIGAAFDGDDTLRSQYNASSSAGTMAARVRVALASSGFDVIIGCQNNDAVSRNFISFEDGVFNMGIGNLSGASFQDSGAVDRRSSSVFINVAGVYDSGNAEIFINGSSVGTGSYGGSPATLVYDIAARNLAGNGDLKLLGDIQFALAADYALSGAQISDLHDYWDSIA